MSLEHIARIAACYHTQIATAMVEALRKAGIVVKAPCKDAYEPSRGEVIECFRNRGRSPVDWPRA